MAWKKYAVLAIACILAVAAALMLRGNRSEVYSASASLSIRPSYNVDDEEVAETERAVFLDERPVSEVVAKYDLVSRWEMDPTSAASRIRQNVEVMCENRPNQPELSRIVFRYTDSDAERVREILQHLVEAYLVSKSS